MKLTIDRAKWLRGDSNSALLRESDGKMCCLGFLALQCGYTDNDIRGKATPSGAARRGLMDDPVNKFPAAILESEGKWVYTPELTSNLIHYNDVRCNGQHYVTEEEREAKLTELFKQAGIDVEFIN